MNPCPSRPSRRPGTQRPHQRRPEDDLRGGDAVITDEEYKVQLPRVDGGRRPVACGGSTRRCRRTRMWTSTPMPSLPPPRQCSTRKGGGGAAPPPPSSIPPPRTVSTDNSGHSSRPTHASCRAGCRVASPHAAASHLPAPLIAASPFVPLVRPAGCHVSSLLTLPHPICQRPRLSSLSRHRLLSRPSQASHPAG